MAGIQDDAVTMKYAKAVYGFDSAGDGELTITENEVLTILRQNVGDGWWEAKNHRGQVGLVPEAYLEITSVPEPNFPPPPPPAVQPPINNRNSWGKPPISQFNNNQRASVQPAMPPPPSWQQNARSSAPPNSYKAPAPVAAAAAVPVAPPPAVVQPMRSQESFDDWADDDSWDDDDSSTTTEHPDLGSTGGSGGSGNKRDKKDKDDNKFGTVKARPFSKYSNFTKSGGETYLFAQSQVPIPVEEYKATVVDSSDGPCWLTSDTPFSCAVTSPTKETKFKGIKAYTAYKMVPSFSNIQVSRRYKHFDWLHGRLEHKFTTICVPPLPDKQVSGRFDDDFVQDRMRQLQLWVDRLCQHPVLHHSNVFHHFLTCTDEKKWKQGKRKAEKDDLQGGTWFLTVQTPQAQLDAPDTEVKLDKFSRYVRNMDDSVRHLMTITDTMAKKQQGPFRKEYARLGGSFVALAKSFEFDERPSAQPLTNALHNTGKVYEDIGQLFHEQPRHDILPLMEGLHEYKGVLSTFPDVLNVYRAACAKIHENAGRFTDHEIHEVQDRADVIAYATVAEMNEFNTRRVRDYKQYMQHFLTAQINFFKQVTSNLEGALQEFDNDNA